jgi:tRNA (cytidine/uridine-2'-O-)-methyltransferase
MLNIALLAPEIPHNAGAVGRTCLVTGCRLHLIRPLGFDTSEKAVRRAGLDYWKDVDVTIYDDLADFKARNPLARPYMATTRADRLYAGCAFKPGDFVMFGRESGGIPLDILQADWERAVRVPMMEGRRSLNLSVSVGIVVYEALRQNGFRGLQI